MLTGKARATTSEIYSIPPDHNPSSLGLIPKCAEVVTFILRQRGTELTIDLMPSTVFSFCFMLE